MLEYKIHTQRDKTFSGAFAQYTRRGWMAVCGGIHGLQPLEEHEERDRAHPRAAPPYHRPSDMRRTPTGRRHSTIAASHVAVQQLGA